MIYDYEFKENGEWADVTLRCPINLCATDVPKEAGKYVCNYFRAKSIYAHETLRVYSICVINRLICRKDCGVNAVIKGAWGGANLVKAQTIKCGCLSNCKKVVVDHLECHQVCLFDGKLFAHKVEVGKPFAHQKIDYVGFHVEHQYKINHLCIYLQDDVLDFYHVKGKFAHLDFHSAKTK